MQADSPLHVLFIDDHRTMRKIIARCLREIGITAIADAGNGAEALAWLAIRLVPNAVIAECRRRAATINAN